MMELFFIRTEQEFKINIVFLYYQITPPPPICYSFFILYQTTPLLVRSIQAMLLPVAQRIPKMDVMAQQVLNKNKTQMNETENF